MTLGKAMLLIGMCGSCFAERSFSIPDGSTLYSAKITVHGCEEKTCSGRGTVQLVLKKTGKVFQDLASEDLYFFLDEKTAKPTVNVAQLYDEQSPLIFGDFNFDGTEDLAVRNGNNGAYGSPSYDVYVYNITRHKFVKSKELTELATTALGMFQVDQKQQRLRVLNKGGCCWHIMEEYRVVPGKGLQKVKSVTEDATKDPDKFVIVTEKNFVGGVWKSTTKKYAAKEYYK